MKVWTCMKGPNFKPGYFALTYITQSNFFKTHLKGASTENQYRTHIMMHVSQQEIWYKRTSNYDVQWRHSDRHVIASEDFDMIGNSRPIFMNEKWPLRLLFSWIFMINIKFNMASYHLRNQNSIPWLCLKNITVSKLGFCRL